MKRITLFFAFTLLVGMAFGGGLITNTNQSAQFIRMMSRNASLGIDAVYYNPAGLTKLDDGWHFGIYNQSVFQTRTVESKFPFLNNSTYEGSVTSPIYPNVYVTYKKDKLALSFGLAPVGGGGSAEFDNGIPSFEIPISKVVPMLAPISQLDPNLAVNGYSADLSFTGSSVYLGFQLGASYEINDVLSVYGGVRYIPAINKYSGSITNVQLKSGGDYYPAPAWLAGAASQMQGTANEASGAAAQMQPLIDNGAGSFTLAMLEGAGAITPQERAFVEGGLLSVGLSQEQINGMSASSIQGAFTQTAATLNQTAGALSSTGQLLGDKHVDTEQSGNGFTPILGVNISPNDDWNIAIKYEHKTYLTVKNETKVDDLGLFPDGAETNNDIPHVIALGVGYRGIDKLEVQLSYNAFLNQQVEWGANVRDIAVWESVDPSKIRAREVDGIGHEAGLGFQFNVSDNFAISAGGLYSVSPVKDSYQSDFSYTNPAVAAGAGIEWKITEDLVFDFGVSSIFYQDVTVEFTDPDIGLYKDTYGKSTLSVAAGLSFYLF